MKKNICFAAALAAGLTVGTSAMAQDLILSLDVRPTAAAITTPASPFTLGQDANGTASNGGGRGEGQILRLNPVHSNNFHTTFGAIGYPNFDGDGDLSTGSLYLYGEMNDKAGDGDVLASLGLNFDVRDSVATGSTGGQNRLANVAFSFDANGLWNGVNDGTSDAGDPPSIEAVKAVRVPVEDMGGPVFNATLGLTPADGLTRLGELAVEAGNCVPGSAALGNQTFEVFMSPNNLLITRAWDPNNPGSGPEMVAFGYDSLGADYAAGTGATDAAVSGESVDTTSSLPDAIIRIQIKGDFNNSGTVTNADIPPLSAALSGGLGASQSLIYTYDFNGSGSVTNADIPAFGSILSGNAPACP